MKPHPSKLFLAALAAVLLAVPAAAPALADDSVSGTASAAGPDIIKINGQSIVLLGIDAPEANQPCHDNGKDWGCADTAFAVLDQTVKQGTVTCQLSGAPDPFGKRGGLCTVNGKDVGDELIKQGLAVAYPHDPESKNYLADQKTAKAAKLGLWADGVSFDMPWVWRGMHNHTPFK